MGRGGGHIARSLRLLARPGISAPEPQHPHYRRRFAMGVFLRRRSRSTPATQICVAESHSRCSSPRPVVKSPRQMHSAPDLTILAGQMVSISREGAGHAPACPITTRMPPDSFQYTLRLLYFDLLFY